MSKDAHTSGVQGESEIVDTNNGGPSRAGTSKSALQVETIKVLDEILANFMAQCTSMHNACRLVATALKDNPSLTPEQHANTYSTYRHHLEEALIA